MENEVLTPEWALISAVRYALGRTTYIINNTCNLVIRLWPTLSEQTQDTIRQDVEEQFRRYEEEIVEVYDESGRYKGGSWVGSPLGVFCDAQDWKRVRALWRKENQ